MTTMTDAPVVVLRRIYPIQSPCPRCSCREHIPEKRSHSRGHSWIYRQCAQTDCGTTYRVPLMATEIENPDGSTRLELPAR